MAFVGRLFGKSKRRGAPAEPISVTKSSAQGEDDRFSESDFAIGDASAFWHWFGENAAAAGALNHKLQNGDNPEELLQPLFNALQRFDGGLSLLVGYTDSGDSELIISADGVSSRFPSVTRLVAAAPVIPGWRITAFKPRIDVSTNIEVNGRNVGTSTATFMSNFDSVRKHLNIEVTLPWLGPMPEDIQAQITFLLLDNLLGEFDVATLIGHVEVTMCAEGQMPSGKPLTLLPGEVDALTAQRPRH